jgi:hypothetical protein
MVLQHIKDGSLTTKDMNTLMNVHPDMYKQLQSQIQTAMLDAKAPVPYKQRLSMSLFLGQPLDSTMTQSAILNAQPIPMNQQPQGGAPGNRPKRSTSSLDKLPGQYKTPGQAAEGRRSEKD